MDAVFSFVAGLLVGGFGAVVYFIWTGSTLIWKKK